MDPVFRKGDKALKICEYMRDHLLFMDGAMGTQLQKTGLRAGEAPCMWNLTHPGEVKKVHRAYYDAGSNVVCTNTFGAHLMHYDRDILEKIIFSAVKNAREAAEESTGVQPKWVALDVSPLGRMLQPMGDTDPMEAVRVFSESIRMGKNAGADLILIETMTDLAEARAALLAAKETCDLPVFVSNAWEKEGRLLTGADPETVVTVLGHMGADAVGVNCSYGPAQLAGIIKAYLEFSPVPVFFKPNTGLPEVKNENTVFGVTPDGFALEMESAVQGGVNAVGGCCGTDPDYIAALVRLFINRIPAEREMRHRAAVTSLSRTVRFGNTPVLIGERINPTGKPRFRHALTENDLGFILNEGVKQEELGAHLLDVNTGAPGISEREMLPRVIRELQTVTNLPLVPDTADPDALSEALRVYPGRALINSVNAGQESMDRVFPLAKKYGSMLICLTLDENGIPTDAEGRFRLAGKLLDEAEKYGLEKEDLIFDPLTLSVSADAAAAEVTLQTIRMIREKLHARVCLGVSNVSFGLPCRDGVNSVFFTLALQQGLSAAIMNPDSREMMNAYYSFLLLRGQDENCRRYITFAGQSGSREAPPEKRNMKNDPSLTDETESLSRAVLRGLKADACRMTLEMLKQERKQVDIINGELIPALDRVGREYEARRIFLPQMMASADTVSACFELLSRKEETAENRENFPVVLASVKGDVHDIGKNIAGMLLKNYGFRVIDLGKDVPARRVADAVLDNRCRFCGLSALMTTTLPAMAETVALLKKEAPFCRVAVGGAVLTREYAEKLGADLYVPDAMSTVRGALEACGKLADGGKRDD